jgi:hypothetical protein
MTILEDSSCFKVVVHGVNTQDFNSDESLSLIREEIELFNPGIELTTNPIWLTSYAKKQEQQGASILVTVQTEEEAKTAIQNRLFVGGLAYELNSQRINKDYLRIVNVKYDLTNHSGKR